MSLLLFLEWMTGIWEVFPTWYLLFGLNFWWRKRKKLGSDFIWYFKYWIQLEQVFMNGSFRQRLAYNFFKDQCKENNIFGEDRRFFQVERWQLPNPLNSKWSSNVLWKDLAKNLAHCHLPASVVGVNRYLHFAFSSRDYEGEFRKSPLHPPVRKELQAEITADHDFQEEEEGCCLPTVQECSVNHWTHRNVSSRQPEF